MVELFSKHLLSVERDALLRTSGRRAPATPWELALLEVAGGVLGEPSRRALGGTYPIRTLVERTTRYLAPEFRARH